MTFFNYTTGIPAANNNPSDDQPNMLVNTNSDNGIWNVDHFGFNDNLGGWHDIIHIPGQISDPAAVTSPANAGQLYTIPYTNPTTSVTALQLRFEDETGAIYKFTNLKQSGGSAGPPPTWNNKYTLPGGLTIIQGNSVINTTATAITFPFGGFTTCFGVVISIVATSAATTDTVVQQVYPTGSQFTARVNASGSRNCAWIAMGV